MRIFPISPPSLGIYTKTQRINLPEPPGPATCSLGFQLPFTSGADHRNDDEMVSRNFGVCFLDVSGVSEDTGPRPLRQENLRLNA